MRRAGRDTLTWSASCCGQALPADMLSKNVETLKNMNSTTAKFAKWYVRVIDPKVIDYTFSAKGEQIQAQKFQCVLVSKEPGQYMLGLVPFDFKNRGAAVAAQQQFKPDSVWELTTPGSRNQSSMGAR